MKTVENLLALHVYLIYSGKFGKSTILRTSSKETFKMYLHIPTEHFDVKRRHVINDFRYQTADIH